MKKTNPTIKELTEEYLDIRGTDYLDYLYESKLLDNFARWADKRLNEKLKK
jgi:hypothetical protein